MPEKIRGWVQGQGQDKGTSSKIKKPIRNQERGKNVGAKNGSRTKKPAAGKQEVDVFPNFRVMVKELRQEI